MNVVIVGIKHAGKSTLGKALAEERDSLFVDSDELIEANYLLNNGEQLSCREIFEKVGRDKFRQLEAEALLLLHESSEEDDQERVIALGGGVADNQYLDVNILKNLGLIVFIKISRDVAWKRILAKGVPPFLDGHVDPREAFEALADSREHFYQKHADVIVQLRDEEDDDNDEEDEQSNLEILQEKLKGYI